MGEQPLAQCLSQVSILHLFEVFLQCRQLCEGEPDGAARSMGLCVAVSEARRERLSSLSYECGRPRITKVPGSAACRPYAVFEIVT